MISKIKSKKIEKKALKKIDIKRLKFVTSFFLRDSF